MVTKFNTTKERLAAFIEEATGEYHDTTEFDRETLVDRVEWVEANSFEWYGMQLKFVDWAN